MSPGLLEYRGAFSSGASCDLEANAGRYRSLVKGLRQARSAAIIGGHGTGKSTLLHCLAADLESEMPGGKWVQLHRGQHRSGRSRLAEIRENISATLGAQSSVAEGGVLVIDGGEQLPFWARWIVRRRAMQKGAMRTGGSRHYCLITAHRPMPGFETLHQTNVETEVIESLIDELSKTCDVPVSNLIHEHVRSLEMNSTLNVRDLWSDLYDLVEQHSSANSRVA